MDAPGIHLEGHHGKVTCNHAAILFFAGWKAGNPRMEVPGWSTTVMSTSVGPSVCGLGQGVCDSFQLEVLEI